MSDIYDLARTLGNALARTDEYQALRRAMSAADEDRELVELRNRIEKLEEQLETALRTQREPDEDIRKAYAGAAEELQTRTAFQRVVAAQSNFEKVMYRVNETVASGIEEGAQSRIIIPS
jgi:cell fate (sporulation/competence/biofilm development) regulator YlbF (YheA/YmcA/DUF963 family)